MTFPQVYQLYDYWLVYPPEHELVQIGIRAYTNWKPFEKNPDPPEIAHRKSLEHRWANGYLNVKQMLEGGGAKTMNFTKKVVGDPADMPGIGRFPGAPPKAQAAAP